jgi:APA family basic amino acid/polyamine antiporter
VTSGSTIHTSLRRDLGLLDAVGVGFGAIVGAGIFVVIGVAAAVAGPAVLVALALAGIAATCNALSSAQLAAEYPRAGGTYEYGYQVLGPWAGFSAGWMFLASKIAAAGTVALGLAGYVQSILPYVPPRALAVTATLAFTALNWFGVKRSSTVNLAIVAVSLGSLLIFVVAGAPSVEFARLKPFAPAGVRGTLEASALLFFAYTGYARIATLGEEVRDPRHTIPRAIIITLAGALVLYAAVAFVAVGAAGSGPLSDSPAPLHAAARTFPHAWVAPVVAVGGVTAMLGVILSQLLGLSRMAFAMARRGDLPAGLAAVDPAHGVPRQAVLAIGVVTAIVAATGTLVGVASAAAFTILVYYGIANLAALRMPSSAKLYPDAVTIIGLASCALLAISLSPRAIGTGLVLLVAGLVWRVLWVRLRAA